MITDVPKYLLVEMSAAPLVFLRVVEAKGYLSSGKAKTLAEAARMADLSRSALYKYKDLVFAYSGKSSTRMITVRLVLKDRPGVLAAVISEFYKARANILTLNQNIPVSSLAPVSITARVDDMLIEVDELIAAIKMLDGVERIENIAGE